MSVALSWYAYGRTACSGPNAQPRTRMTVSTYRHALPPSSDTYQCVPPVDDAKSDHRPSAAMKIVGSAMIHSPKCGRMSGFAGWSTVAQPSAGARAHCGARALRAPSRSAVARAVAARGSRPRPSASAGTPVSGSPASGRALSAMYQHTSWAQSDGTSGKKRPHERDDEKRPSTSSERRKSATRGATTTCGKSVVHRTSPSGLKRTEKSTATKTASARAQAPAAERGLGAHTRAPPFFGGGSVDMRVDRVTVEVNGSGIAANRGQPRSPQRAE